MQRRNQKTVAFISELSPTDRLAWSGTVHYVYRSLETAGYQVKALGPAKLGFTRILLAALNKLSLFSTGRRFDYRHSVPYTKAFGKLFTEKLKLVPHDLVVVCGSTEYGAYIESERPIVYVLDRVIQGALNYHSILSDLWRFSMSQSVFTDKKAMTEAAHLFFSSEWAASHARLLYGIPAEKITVAAFGANIDTVPSRAEALATKDLKECKLLFIGTSWKNKGADIAYRAMKNLNDRGLPARLTIVGCSPPQPINDSRLTVIPFVDKNSPEGREELGKLYLSHHFFILPTRFDCTPIVFCEASAYGLPVLSARTGGVEGHVFEGVNGFLLPYEDTRGAGYAEKAHKVFTNPGQFQRLCETSRECYEKHLNWSTWAESFTAKTDPLIT